MISPSEYYEKNLYPLQDGVLNIAARCSVRFYLTGGTALSRAYYNHRYSDDLDFFVSNDETFTEQVKLVFSTLEENGFKIDRKTKFIRNPNFWSFFVRDGKHDCSLKLDFVSDLVPHFGDIVETDFYYRVDPIFNILSNKLSALFRFAGKDVADLREIALHEKINWPQIIREAGEKDAGIDLAMTAEILQGIPRSAYDEIIWVKEPGWETFGADIGRIVEAMIRAE